MIYLDNAASMPVFPEVMSEAMTFMSECCGNPSSIHTEGRRAALAIMSARKVCADIIGAFPEEIYFTSGGTESDNLALFSAAYSGRNAGRNRVVVSEIEHPAVLSTCKALEKQGFEVNYIGVDSDGFIDMEKAEELIDRSTAVVSVMTANNVVGTIQPTEEVSRLCQRNGAVFHTDAVQAAGHILIDVGRIGCDMLSVSAHKFGGIKGAGFLYCRSGLELIPQIYGGGQENGIRSGTENTAAIIAMAKALSLSCVDMEEKSLRIRKMRDRLIAELLSIPDSRLNGGMERRLSGNVNVSFAGVEGESLVLGLDLRGVCASSGSACSSGEERPSHVLAAMGIPAEMLRGSLRLTLSEINTLEEIDKAALAVRETVATLRELVGFK